MGRPQDCKLFSIDSPTNSMVTFTPNPPLFGIPISFNYSISNLSTTSRSTALFVGFFGDGDVVPFDSHVIQLQSNVTEYMLTDLYINTPLHSTSYTTMLALADDVNGFIDCVTFEFQF
ncbi:3865_t:CDS:2 [Cetraspora pellucida]|uniref:3865_t:CDS:1 n=1 Tax=Cetraspora pellucida TaxID=1433469 RepID=A0A9N8Z426_9GLOM|nr:3865_t:CDS:2 [Cetraspora pellucida]